ncbi:hypothetical protein ACW0FT_003726 [Vibrio alginolyticus]|uniref:hypothetical protein n=1 Tax=Vibrio harveyi group TaxID=717610 RepID=UPI003AAB65F3
MKHIMTTITSMLFYLLIFNVSSAHANNEEGKFSIVYAVNAIEYATKLGPIETDTKSINTKDHHCDSNCKGEPTRTAYRIDYSVNPLEYKIVGASLACDAGASCSYNGNRKTGFTNNTAFGSFDVWSRPSKWTLTIQRQPILNIDGKIHQIDSDHVRSGRSFVIIHDTSKYKAIELEVTMPFGQLTMNPANPVDKYFELVSSSKIGTTHKYTILFKGHKAL